MALYGSGKDTNYGGAGVSSARDSRGRYAGSQGVEWGGLDAVVGEMAVYEEELRRRILANCEALKEEMVAYMQEAAPWDDRTGDARAALQGQVIEDDRSIKIYLGHGAEIFYGYFLENYTYSGTSYAIIMPTIERYSGEIMARAVA